MSIATATTITAPFVVAMILTGVVVTWKTPGRIWWCDILVLVGCVSFSVFNVIWALTYPGFILRPFFSVMSVWFAWRAWLIWRDISRRRKRRHIRKLIGAKARLIRDKMVKRVRERRLKPRLRPVPHPV
jgi:uncharacterized membrane protein YfcA